MVKPELAVISATWGSTTKAMPVQFNPTEFSLEKGLQLAEINIPGLDAPLQQFIRGQAEKLSVELFFDTTEYGMGVDATSVTGQTDWLYLLTKIESGTHAPPLVTFSWNSFFPGDSIAAALAAASSDADISSTAGAGAGSAPSTNQARTSFTGVVESLRQKFTLFSPEGVPLRATVNLVLREYRTLEEQLNQLNLNSPDRTHGHILRAHETLDRLADSVYHQPGEWRRIAENNDIYDPRRLTPGTTITIPVME